jgi:solute carrier family 50 protein (sugar transporter)
MLFLAPMLKVIAVIKSGQLQDLNPLPYPFIAANCAAWALGFAVVTDDPYIFFANFLGLCTGVFYTLGTYPLATFQMRLAIMLVSVAATAALALVGFLGVWTGLDADGLRTLWYAQHTAQHTVELCSGSKEGFP